MSLASHASVTPPRPIAFASSMLRRTDTVLARSRSASSGSTLLASRTSSSVPVQRARRDQQLPLEKRQLFIGQLAVERQDLIQLHVPSSEVEILSIVMRRPVHTHGGRGQTAAASERGSMEQAVPAVARKARATRHRRDPNRPLPFG